MTSAEAQSLRKKRKGDVNRQASPITPVVNGMDIQNPMNPGKSTGLSQ